MTILNLHISLYRIGERGKWHWRLCHNNGLIVAEGGRAYKLMGKAMGEAAKLFPGVEKFEIRTYPLLDSLSDLG